jgi:catechol 2,3-dioxygenase-like lactoylglutathione lyase family enzyme
LSVVLGIVAVFMICASAGAASWVLAALGLAVMAAGVCLYVVSALNSREFAYVPGTANVQSCSPPPASASFGRCIMQLIVHAPGTGDVAVKIRETGVPVSKWPHEGSTLPILVAIGDRRRVRVLWENVRSHSDVAEGLRGQPFGEDSPEEVDEQLQETDDATPLDESYLGDLLDSGYPDGDYPAEDVMIDVDSSTRVIELDLMDPTVFRISPAEDDLDEVPDLLPPEPMDLDAQVDDGRPDDEAPSGSRSGTPGSGTAGSTTARSGTARSGAARSGTARSGPVPLDDPPGVQESAGIRESPGVDESAGVRLSPAAAEAGGAPPDVPGGEGRRGPGDLGGHRPPGSRPAGSPPSPRPRSPRPCRPSPDEMLEPREPGALLTEEPPPARERGPVREPVAAPVPEPLPADSVPAPEPTTATEPAPIPTAPVSAARMPAAPAATDPGLTEPAPGDPASTDPAPTGPALTGATSADATPSAATPTSATPTSAESRPASATRTAAESRPTSATRTAAESRPTSASAAPDAPASAAPEAPSMRRPSSLRVEHVLSAEPAVPAMPRSSIVGDFAEDGEISDAYLTVTPPPGQPEPGGVRGVSVTLFVSHLGRSVAFYRDALGFVQVDMGLGSAVLESGDCRVELRRVADMTPVDRRLVHLMLEVPDVQAAYEDLSGRGIEFVHRPRAVSRYDQLELWSAAFRDPDGHGIALIRWDLRR